MGGTRDYHTEWSKSEREMPYDTTYMWNLSYDTNELIYKTETDSQTLRTDLWFPRGKWSGRGMDWEFWISRCKLCYIERINNKALLCSIGNYIQYPVINHNGKEYACMYAKVPQLYPTICDPMSGQAPLSMGFSRQEYWSGLPCPSPILSPLNAKSEW